MTENALWALGASSIVVSGGGSLSGEVSGCGRHLLGCTLTLAQDNWAELMVVDARSGASMSDAQIFDGIAYGEGLRITAEYILTVTDGRTPYRLVGFNIQDAAADDQPGLVEGLVALDDGLGFPPAEVALKVIGASHSSDLEDDKGGGLILPPSLVEGAEVLTLDGALPVQELQIGDMVITRDAGAQALRWISRVEVSSAQMAATPGFRPVRFATNSMGPGRPSRDTMLPPSHRVLIRNARAAVLFGEREVLAAAQHLINDATILPAKDLGGIVYFHLLFDDHQIVYADGLEVESLPPGRDVLMMIPEAEKADLIARMPELPSKARSQQPGKRRQLKYWEAAAMA